MALIVRELINKYNYVFTELRDPRVDGFFLMSSPLPILSIVAAYIYFVRSLGPRLMRDRPPLKLDRIIQVYDVIQIALSLYLITKSLMLTGHYSLFCEPVDYSTTPHALEVLSGVYVYFVVKVIDLLDTVFFVLRKKDRQITFLHVYHHAMMAAGIWVGVKFVGGGHSTFMGFINSIVHAVMYTYYLVTSIYPQHKQNIWWKKHITQLQMVQFVMIIVHSSQILLQPDCNYPKGFSMVLVPQNVFMLILFYDFYRKAYLPKTSEETPAAHKTK